MWSFSTVHIDGVTTFDGEVNFNAALHAHAGIRLVDASANTLDLRLASGNFEKSHNGGAWSGYAPDALTLWPVGALYFHTANTNPGTFLGGTWEAYGTGRMLVGVDATDTDFHEVGHTGGSKAAVLLAHAHTGTHGMADGGSTHNVAVAGGVANAGVDSAGVADTGNQNLPPYIVVYIWKRTA
jgi:hypothetical protein